jgi:ArsR family transcriptional regulator
MRQGFILYGGIAAAGTGKFTSYECAILQAMMAKLLLRSVRSMSSKKVRAKVKPPFDLIRSTSTLKALAHPSRIRIISELRKGGRSVGDLAETLGLSQSMTSQHLRVMIDCKLLSREKKQTKTYYSISDDDGRIFLKCLENMGPL